MSIENQILQIAENQKLIYQKISDYSVGKKIEQGGIVFNDIENNEAGPNAAAFGERSKAAGYASFATGARKDASGDYPIDENGKEIIPDDAWRYNESIGTGAMTAGMGAVAFSRASKSFGYRTQTGYPPSSDEVKKRTHYEMRSSSSLQDWVIVSEEDYNKITDTALRREVIEVETLITKESYSNLKCEEYEGDLHSYGGTGNDEQDELEKYLHSEVHDGTGFITLDLSPLAPQTDVKNVIFPIVCSTEGSSYIVTVSLLDSNKIASDHQIFDIEKDIMKTINVEFGITIEAKYLRISGTCNNDPESDDISCFCELDLGLEIVIYPEENIGQAAFAIGADTAAVGGHAFAGGNKTIASGENSLAFGGNDTTASGKRAIATGYGVIASGQDSFAANRYTVAEGLASSAFGQGTKANKSNQMVAGLYNATDVDALFIIGNGTSDTDRSNAFTVSNSGYASILYGLTVGGCSITNYTNTKTRISSNYPLIELVSNRVTIGYSCNAGVNYSIAGGYNAKTSGGQGAIALGNSCSAEGKGAFAGGSSHATGNYSVAIGSATYASNSLSAAFGDNTQTGYNGQFVVGRYNQVDSDSYFVVGKGSSSARSNAFVIDSKGNAKAAGSHTSTGADYAEMFEWKDGNPESEDRIGYVVALDGEKIRLAKSGDEILGVISGTAAVLGDSASMNWKNKYITDDFGRIRYELVEEFEEEEDPETGEVTKISLGFFNHPCLNPEYNSDEVYIPREERPEWSKVGLMGKLYTRDDGTCIVGGYATVGTDGVLTNSESATNIRVMKRTSDNIVWVLLK